MLQITIPATEQWDEIHECFINTNEQILQLEHSLISISKWESEWCIPFLDAKEKSIEQTIDYIRCMTLNSDVDSEIYNSINDAQIKQVNDYIEKPMTASVIFDGPKGKSSGERITSELMYYWIVAMNIPMECEEWHLNRLLMLIKVCSAKNQPPRKMNKKEIMDRNHKLNEARKRQMNTKG